MCGHMVLISTLLPSPSVREVLGSFYSFTLTCKNQHKEICSKLMKTGLVPFLCFPGASNLLRAAARQDVFGCKLFKLLPSCGTVPGPSPRHKCATQSTVPPRLPAP